MASPEPVLQHSSADNASSLVSIRLAVDAPFDSQAGRTDDQFNSAVCRANVLVERNRYVKETSIIIRPVKRQFEYRRGHIPWIHCGFRHTLS